MDSPVEQLERDLVRALIEGQSWLLTNEQIDQLRSVTIGDEALRDLGHWKSPVYLNSEFVAGQWEGRVGQSRHIGLKLVCAKLAQYPAGTAFTFEIKARPIKSTLPDPRFSTPLPPIPSKSTSHQPTISRLSTTP